MKRRQQNNIEALLIEGTGWCFDNDMLRWHATDYFSKLYTVDNYLTGSFPIRGHFLKLETNVIRELLAKVTEEEVRCSVFSMSPLKAPEADGFHAKFYQANWEVVGVSVFNLVKCVFSGECLNPRLNKTFLVLVPKIFRAETINQFRPISLCNVLYKIITKTILICL